MAPELHYKVSLANHPPHEDIEWAKRAIDAGFDGIWVGDHLMPWIDARPYTHDMVPWVSTFMNEVPDVPVGTVVTCPMIRHRPPVLAHSIATLDHMYPGRFQLGVGTGEALNEAHFIDGEWPSWGERADMLVEAIEVMRTLWGSDDYVSYDGEHFSYDDIKLFTNAKSEIPIHWAAWGPKSCYRAGRHAGNIVTVVDAETVANRIVPAFEDGLADAGRDRNDAEVTVETGVSVGDPDTIVATAREECEYIPDDTELDNPDPRDVQRVGEERLADMSDADVLDAQNYAAEPDDVIDRIDAFDDAGVDRLIVGHSIGSDADAFLDMFADDILPQYG